MEVQTQQNKHSSTKRRKGANNWGNQKRLQKQQTQDSACGYVQIVHIKIIKEYIYIYSENNNKPYFPELSQMEKADQR